MGNRVTYLDYTDDIALLDDHPILTHEHVEQFTYLGSCKTAVGNDHLDLFTYSTSEFRFCQPQLSLEMARFKLESQGGGLPGLSLGSTALRDLWRREPFKHRGLRRIARVWWHNHVSNTDVGYRVFGMDSPAFCDVVNSLRLPRLGHVSRMNPRRLLLRTLRALADRDRQRRPGGQPLIWKRA